MKRIIVLFLMGLACFGSHIQAAVTSISGNVGTAQSGSIVFSGVSSGLVFNSTTATITSSVDFVALPLTTSTCGHIGINGDVVLHAYGTSNQNIFIGGLAGNFITTGANTTACGYGALPALTSGSFNTAVGCTCLESLTEGGSNTAVGKGAGAQVVTGSNNILIGIDAGVNYSDAESSNIIIGSNAGIADESLTIRIGDGQAQQDCYISGIYGSTVNTETGLAVVVDAVGKLGTIVSSLRFKDDIQGMENDSARIMDLHPVSFIRKHDVKQRKQFGLIAEEVYKVFPELAITDKHGSPYAVRYHDLPILLMNELQKQEVRIQNLEDRIGGLLGRVTQLEAAIKIK